MELYILYPYRIVALYKHSDDILLNHNHTTTHIKYTYEVTITYLLYIHTIKERAVSRSLFYKRPLHV